MKLSVGAVEFSELQTEILNILLLTSFFKVFM
jgi:hypothetical protein